MEKAPENETESLADLQEKKADLLVKYKALKEKRDLADNDCDRGFVEEERSALALKIKALARRIEALQQEQA